LHAVKLVSIKPWLNHLAGRAQGKAPGGKKAGREKLLPAIASKKLDDIGANLPVEARLQPQVVFKLVLYPDPHIFQRSGIRVRSSDPDLYL
jgi:hypothetical protein